VFNYKLVIGAFLWLGVVLGAPQVVYLTWVGDPCHEMTVQWHTARGKGEDEVAYCQSRIGRWKVVESISTQVAGTEVDVHVAHLKGLDENSEYRFKVEGEEYHFRTMPSRLRRAVKVAVGGDIFYPGKSELFQKMTHVVASQDPDCVILGGDLAYTIISKWSGTRGWQMGRWQGLLQELQKMGKDGRLIPLIPVVGNHDVKKGSSLFYEIFAFPEKGRAYRMLDVGDYLSIALLDTDHTSPIEGEQTAWLEENLKKRQGVRHLVAAYHQAAFPSYYPYESEGPTKIRKHWVPLFEAYGVKLAFEHHNHRYKRTYPLKGVTYVGDGSWGIKPRAAGKKHDYLAKSESINACYFVTLTSKECKVEARDAEGAVVDEVVCP
jgi:acid phosphatase type 7